MKEHQYKVNVVWTGNTGEGTRNYRSYSRNHVISAGNKPEIPASSDPNFRGDPARYNPEELFVSTLSTCHMLWYLHLCATNKITVLAYEDSPAGVMAENEDGSGEFLHVRLNPRITIAMGDNLDRARQLHHEAHRFCFIANSVKFPVEVVPEVAESSESGPERSIASADFK